MGATRDRNAGTAAFAPTDAQRMDAPSASRTTTAVAVNEVTIMFIQTEATPNPATLKFLPGRIVLSEGTMDFRKAEDASASPLAEKLFAVEGIEGIFFGHDFISVTKGDRGLAAHQARRARGDHGAFHVRPAGHGDRGR